MIGAVNLWKVFRLTPVPRVITRPIVTQPFLLGMLFAARFETASQLSVLVLVDRPSPWLIGLAFCGGMVLVNGFDDYLVASTQSLAATGEANARIALRSLGILVIIVSFGLGGAELLGLDLNSFALPLGLALFAIVVAIRVWARSDPRSLGAEVDLMRLRLLEFPK